MAEAKPQKKGGNPLTKKVGPLPVWGWAGVGGGLYLVMRYIGARKAASTAAAGSALMGGTTIPGNSTTSGASSATGSGLPSFSSTAAWEQAAISAMSQGNLSPADALNGLTSWLNGQCVSAAQYSGISSIINTVGLPPGYGTGIPPLSVCGSPTTGGGTGTGGTTTVASTATGPAPIPQGYYQLSGLQPVLDLLGMGGTAYQSGQEAIDWNNAHGGNNAGIDPGSYYALSPAAAQNLAQSGRPVYQSAADANAWNILHPTG